MMSLADRSARCSDEGKDEKVSARHSAPDGIPQGAGRSKADQGTLAICRVSSLKGSGRISSTVLLSVPP